MFTLVAQIYISVILELRDCIRDFCVLVVHMHWINVLNILPILLTSME